ncbi:ATP-binding protein [Nocardioides sp. Iso805N]|uniref:ATP-binding protein n=1 Tax=Nocardioides sp. Iso805N TaxID=1283287 RepID=UPI0003811F8B|nr:ATP-binding protein [Nocardioides sp. Iso805N]
MSHSESHELAATVTSIAAARSIVAGAGMALPSPVRDDAVLLVSELMSNAVRHGGSWVRLKLTISEDAFTVAVHDDGPGMPIMRNGTRDASLGSGRGLQIVDRIADQWGVDVDQAGKTVWFRFKSATTSTGLGMTDASTDDTAPSAPPCADTGGQVP